MVSFDKIAATSSRGWFRDVLVSSMLSISLDIASQLLHHLLERVQLSVIDC